jgi:thioredoxin-related protein
MVVFTRIWKGLINTMKTFVLLAILVLISIVSASSQTALKTKTATKKTSVFAREKFDPNRDAAADVQAALVKATKKNKRIILDVGGEWCGWCIRMDNFIEQSKSLKRLRNKNFLWVKVNFSEENENPALLSKYPAATGYPHLYVLEKDGTLLKSQNTVELEKEKSYDLQKFTDFLNLWKPSGIK